MKTTCLSILIAVVICGQASAQDYQIRLHRPQRVGDKYELSALGTSTQEMLITTNGKAQRTSKTEVTVQLNAIVTVLAVTNGKATRQSMAVSRFKRTENGNLKILAGSGSKVMASVENGKRVYTLNGTGVDRIEQESLNLVADLEPPSPNDDLMFGTRDRKKIGDSWPVNTNLMMRTLNENGRLKISSLSGKATLKDVVQEASGPVLLIDAEITAVTGLPPGVVVDNAAATLIFSGRFPVDVALGRPEDTSEMNLTIQARKPEAKSEIKAHETQSVTLKRTFLH